MAPRFASLLILAVCAACSRQPAITPPPETRAERLAVLDRIAAECRVPRAMMTLVGEDELRLNPPSDLAFERMECVLRRIEQINLPPSRAGYLGNRSSAAAAGADNTAAPEGNDAEAD